MSRFFYIKKDLFVLHLEEPQGNRVLRLAKELIHTPSCDRPDLNLSPRPVLEKLEKLLRAVPACRVMRCPLKRGDPNRWNLVAIRGEGPQVVYFTGHVDTVKPDNESLSKACSPRAEGDILYGCGSSDMKAQLAPVIDAFLYEEVSPMRQTNVLVLLVDEEKEGDGAKQFISDVKNGVLPRSDRSLLLGHELPTAKNQLSKNELGILVGRSGHFMMDLKFGTDHEHHGSDRDRSADLHSLFHREIESILMRDYQAEFADQLPHPYGLRDALEERWSHVGGKAENIIHPITRKPFHYYPAQPDYLTHASQGKVILSYYPAHPAVQVGTAIAYFRKKIEEIATFNRFRERGMFATLRKSNHTSYHPYMLGQDRMARLPVIYRAFKESFGQGGYNPKLVCGTSTSDFNLLMQEKNLFPEGYEVAAPGGEIHNGSKEWILISGMMHLRRFVSEILSGRAFSHG